MVEKAADVARGYIIAAKIAPVTDDKWQISRHVGLWNGFAGNHEPCRVRSAAARMPQTMSGAVRPALDDGGGAQSTVTF